MRKRRRNLHEEPFQMAPMIDMVFLLLVFFMTVGTMAQDARPALDLAESKTVSKPEFHVPRMVLTLMDGEGDEPLIYIGPAIVAEDKALERIKWSVAEDPSVEWELRVGRDVPYRISRTWMQKCTEAGVAHLHLSVFEF